MASLLYIHGFLSSPLSFKAQQVQAWLANAHPSIQYCCPQLSPYPLDTQDILDRCVKQLPKPIYVMGSSLGGFWATWLVERYNLRALLINPAVSPQSFMPDYLHQPLRNYHNDETYCLTEAHIAEICEADVAVTRTENYWVLLQTGDETLDYRHAAEKYQGCLQTIEQGGDHSFTGFERYFEQSLTFFTRES
jgi:predicted esterase YcpF (UPF0227 family)